MLPERTTTCSEPGCAKPRSVRGLCDTHYHRMWAQHHRAGIPLPERICSVEGCGRPYGSRDLCKMHYKRLLKNGTTDDIRPAPEERFWSSVVKTDTCWLWDGPGMGENGYARIKVERKRWLVHRLSWVMANGPIPEGLVVCHHCDVRLCVRPDHLFVGTQSDNIRDCVAKGRHRWNKTS